MSECGLQRNAREIATATREERATMLKAENQKDKERFEKLKDTQVERGRDEESATQVAASEVKEMREREGRAKDPGAGR
jgi:hypothetical protein